MRLHQGGNVKIRVNGVEREIAPRTSVRDLVESLGHRSAAVAVERNREIVPRSHHDATLLEEGDQVEIVTLVGGG